MTRRAPAPDMATAITMCVDLAAHVGPSTLWLISAINDNIVPTLVAGMLCPVIFAAFYTAWMAPTHGYPTEIFVDAFVCTWPVFMFTCIVWPISIPAWILFILRSAYVYRRTQRRVGARVHPAPVVGVGSKSE